MTAHVGIRLSRGSDYGNLQTRVRAQRRVLREWKQLAGALWSDKRKTRSALQWFSNA